MRDVLPVAAVIRESQRCLVENLDEARRTAAMLDIRLAVGGCGRQEETVLLADEGGKPSSISVRQPPASSMWA